MSNTLTNSNCCTVTYDTIRQAMAGEPYTMKLVGRDAEYVQLAVNQGIDSHLEACYVPERGDRYEYLYKLHCTVSVESLPTLLRRLFEMDSEENDGEPALLAEDILRTLGINETGRFVGREALGFD